MITLEDATVAYRGRTALHPTSLDIAPGTFTIVVGPNGAGKSTLLKVMTGEQAPQGGHVRLDGTALAAFPARVLARRRAVLPQSSALAFPFTVAEVVRLGLEAGGHAGGPDAILAALARVDLAGFSGRFYQELSGGEQQRVHLARVLCQIGAPVEAGQPRYLFLDEPISSLDIRHQIGVLRIARRFAHEGDGVLAVLHDLNLAAAFADRILVVAGGRVLGDGSPPDVLTDELIERAFGLPLRVGALPAAGIPFILPQTAA